MSFKFDLINKYIWSINVCWIVRLELDYQTNSYLITCILVEIFEECNKLFGNLELNALADPGFPVGGVDSRGGYVSKLLYIETKESGPFRGEHAPGTPPLDLPKERYVILLCLQ